MIEVLINVGTALGIIVAVAGPIAVFGALFGGDQDGRGDRGLPRAAVVVRRKA